MKSSYETAVQNGIEADLGAEPDLLLLRNSVGVARHFDKRTGRDWHVPYGLGVGSPDLVFILRRTFNVPTVPVTVGTWFCLEVKVPGEEATPEQQKVHAIWQSFGAFVATVTSVDEARAALQQARGER